VVAECAPVVVVVAARAVTRVVAARRTSSSARWISIRFVTSVLSAGDVLRRDRRRRCALALCRGVMRHFRCREFAPSLAVPCLPNRVQPPRAQFRPVTRRRPPNRVVPLFARAVRAEAPAQVAALAEPELHGAPPAGDKPKKFRRQKVPGRRSLDMDLRLWSKVRTPCGGCLAGAPEGSELALRTFAFFRRARSTTTRPTWPRSRLVIGEPRPARPRGFHRVHAVRAARSHPLRRSPIRQRVRAQADVCHQLGNRRVLSGLGQELRTSRGFPETNAATAHRLHDAGIDAELAPQVTNVNTNQGSLAGVRSLHDLAKKLILCDHSVGPHN